MNVDIKSTKALIQKVMKDIEVFNDKTPSEPEYCFFHEIEPGTVSEDVFKFVQNFRLPPEGATAQELIDYYTSALGEIKSVGLDPEKVSFDIDREGYSVVGMMVSKINNMGPDEYYKSVVFNKGQLISFLKENERNLEKLNMTHNEYIKDMDDSLKEKLNDLHINKVKPFNEINSLLEEAVSKLVTEEIKYKPAKKLKR